MRVALGLVAAFAWLVAADVCGPGAAIPLWLRRGRYEGLTACRKPVWLGRMLRR